MNKDKESKIYALILPILNEFLGLNPDTISNASQEYLALQIYKILIENETSIDNIEISIKIN